MLNKNEVARPPAASDNLLYDSPCESRSVRILSATGSSATWGEATPRGVVVIGGQRIAFSHGMPISSRPAPGFERLGRLRGWRGVSAREHRSVRPSMAGPPCRSQRPPPSWAPACSRLLSFRDPPPPPAPAILQ